MILHDRNDAECVKILSNIRKAAIRPARVFIVERVMPEHNVPHFSKLLENSHDVLGYRLGNGRGAICIPVAYTREDALKGS